jgi:hypothetical protein
VLALAYQNKEEKEKKILEYNIDMAEQIYNQKFNGYWREPNKEGLPSISGVYCVYECTNVNARNLDIKRLIYIGESADIIDRIMNHEKLPLWQRYVRGGNELCYSYTQINSPDRYRVEAAFINHHKPTVNTEYVNSFPFDKTNILTSGQNMLLADYFEVNRH